LALSAVVDWHAQLGGAQLGGHHVGELYAQLLGMAERWAERPQGDGQYGTRRKQRGVYVTPRPLVDRLLDDLGPSLPEARVCDPACGAGALLLGWLERQPSRADALARVYGVDLDPLAVELTRLVLWGAAGHLAAPDGLVERVVAGDALFGPSPPGTAPPSVAPPTDAPGHDWRLWSEVWSRG